MGDDSKAQRMVNGASPRYVVREDARYKALAVYDREVGIYLNPQDYIGSGLHGQLIAAYRAAHPATKRWRVRVINH